MESKSIDFSEILTFIDDRLVGSTRVGVTWARERTFGGRSRGTPYGSYRSGGGNRRRSRYINL
jgi:K+-transporting ATPase c subunit